MVAVLASLIASDVWLFGSGRLGSAFRYVLLHPLLLLLVLGLTVLSMLFHECGHAAACRYGGARPGVIGMGFFVIWPAFFTNVTDSYRLGRAGRVRTDLGGVYFNAVFVLLLTVTYLATGYAPLLAAVVLIHLEIVQQLLPSLRFDGYFILADLIGVPDLFRRIGPTLRSMIPGRPADPRVHGLKRAARVTLTAWVLVVVPLIALELGLIILNGPRLARTFAHSLDAQAHEVVAQFGRVDVAAGLRERDLGGAARPADGRPLLHPAAHRAASPPLPSSLSTVGILSSGCRPLPWSSSLRPRWPLTGDSCR